MLCIRMIPHRRRWRRWGRTRLFRHLMASVEQVVSDGATTEAEGVGVNHEKLTYRSDGRDMRLTDVHGRVIKPILA